MVGCVAGWLAASAAILAVGFVVALGVEWWFLMLVALVASAYMGWVRTR